MRRKAGPTCCGEIMWLITFRGRDSRLVKCDVCGSRGEW